MTDLISRQDVLHELGWCDYGLKDWQKLKLKTMVRDIPSAQSECKKGNWEIYIISMLDGEGCKCSECGFEGVPYWNFCPNCGAKMVETQESEG